MYMYFSLIIMFLASVLFVWMAFVEPRRFRLWKINLPNCHQRNEQDLAVLAGRLPELNILHITDTHFRGKRGRDELKLDFLRSVIRDSPPLDFVFITGDILDTPQGLESCMKLADMIETRVGAYAVLGGHDFFRSTELWRKYISIHKNDPVPSLKKSPNPVLKLRKGLKEHGVKVLEEENDTVELVDGSLLAVIGLNDSFFFHCDHSNAWEGVEDDLSTIVIAHSPDVLPVVAEKGAELAFFGHTHGGQVRLPFKGAIVTRSKVGAERARGIFREKNTIFTINQGLGATRGTHVRLCCPPEATLIHVGGDGFNESYVPWRNGDWRKQHLLHTGT